MRKTVMLILGAGLVATAALQLPTAAVAAEWGIIRPEIKSEVIRAGIKVPDVRRKQGSRGIVGPEIKNKQGSRGPDVKNKQGIRGIVGPDI